MREGDSNMATRTMSRPTKRREKSAPEVQAPEKVDRSEVTVAPRVDIYETDKAYVLLADMPGVGNDGLDVTAERDELTIRGHVQDSEASPDYEEFVRTDYERVFVLTEDLDAAQIVATLKDGVLRVEIPKSPRLQPRKIPVRSE
jgi:HSP20 family molecular chaperone IbpA